MNKKKWAIRFDRFKTNAKETLDSPLTYIIGGFYGVTTYIVTGSIKAAAKSSINSMGGFIVTNGVIGTVVDEIADKLED